MLQGIVGIFFLAGHLLPSDPSLTTMSLQVFAYSHHCCTDKCHLRCCNLPGMHVRQHVSDSRAGQEVRRQRHGRTSSRVHHAVGEDGVSSHVSGFLDSVACHVEGVNAGMEGIQRPADCLFACCSAAEKKWRIIQSLFTALLRLQEEDKRNEPSLCTLLGRNRVLMAVKGDFSKAWFCGRYCLGVRVTRYSV